MYLRTEYLYPDSYEYDTSLKDTTRGNYFYKNGKETLVLNQKPETIAMIYTKEPIRFSRKKGYYTNMNTLVAFDLDAFLE